MKANATDIGTHEAFYLLMKRGGNADTMPRYSKNNPRRSARDVNGSREREKERKSWRENESEIVRKKSERVGEREGEKKIKSK